METANLYLKGFHILFVFISETHHIFFFFPFFPFSSMFIWEQIKLTGILGFITALICILVTITTAIIHIQRLQSLKECEFTPKDSICTCYSQILGRTDAWTRSKEGEFNIFFFCSDFMLMQTWSLLLSVVLSVFVFLDTDLMYVLVCTVL